MFSLVVEFCIAASLCMTDGPPKDFTFESAERCRIVGSIVAGQMREKMIPDGMPWMRQVDNRNIITCENVLTGESQQWTVKETF